MAYTIGIVLAVVASGLARWTGLERDRAFYPTLLIVVASYYVLFAAVGGAAHALAVESTVMLAFVLLAVLGFRFGSWLIAAGLAGHGVFDVFHALVVTNAGVPAWWPAFCMTFDVGAGGYLFFVVRAASRRERLAQAATST